MSFFNIKRDVFYASFGHDVFGFLLLFSIGLSLEVFDFYIFPHNLGMISYLVMIYLALVYFFMFCKFEFTKTGLKVIRLWKKNEYIGYQDITNIKLDKDINRLSFYTQNKRYDSTLNISTHNITRLSGFLRLLNVNTKANIPIPLNPETENTIVKLGQIFFYLGLLVCVLSAYLLFQNTWLHFNNTKSIGFVAAPTFIVLIAFIVSFSKNSYAQILSETFMRMALLVVSLIFLFFSVSNFYSEKHASHIVHHRFLLESNTENRQSWKSLSLKLRNKKNISVRAEWQGYNANLQQGRVYILPVTIGRYDDFSFEQSAFHKARAVQKK